MSEIPKSLPMSLSGVMQFAPRQHNLVSKPGDRVGFTMDPVYNFADNPVYENPEHLAAWVVGYWSGKAAADNNN
ncbi:hypothetical protein ACXZ66_11100 [Corynebacterium sp. S7]